MTTKTEAVISFLSGQYPKAACTLDFTTPFQCLVAVILSAQTSDESVNKATPALFKTYPDASSLSQASILEIESKICRLGLYHNKAKNLSALAKTLMGNYHGEVPLDFATLVQLPGVGIKTANVVLMEITRRPSFAVDTHVGRIYKRLGYAKKDDEPIQVEKKLEKAFPESTWIDLHHRSIAFGRDICHAIHPECERCKLTSYCSFFKKASTIKGK